MSVITQAEVDHLVEMNYTVKEIQKIDRKLAKAEKARLFTRMGYQLEGGVQRLLRAHVCAGNRHFEKEAGMEFTTFIQHTVPPMSEYIVRKRHRSDDKRAFRSCQLPFVYRVYRTMCYLRNAKVAHLAYITGQSVTTVTRDVKVIICLIAKVHGRNEIRFPRKRTREYECLRGKGDFHFLDNVPYSADCTIIPIPEPVFDQAEYYHGGKHVHCMVVFTCVDGKGDTRCVVGPMPGRRSENDLLYASRFYRDIHRFAV
jgi:hypothetical protein